MLAVIKKFVATSSRLSFYDLLILFVIGKTDHHINVAHFLKKTLFNCIFGSKPDSF